MKSSLYQPLRWLLSFSLSCRRGIWGTERLSDLLQVTELVSDRTGIKPIPASFQCILTSVSNSNKITFPWRNFQRKIIFSPTFFFSFSFPFSWALEKVSALPRRLFGNKLKYNKSLNYQRNNVLQSKFHEKVIKYQCLINPLSAPGFKMGSIKALT